MTASTWSPARIWRELLRAILADHLPRSPCSLNEVARQRPSGPRCSHGQPGAVAAPSSQRRDLQRVPVMTARTSTTSDPSRTLSVSSANPWSFDRTTVPRRQVRNDAPARARTTVLPQRVSAADGAPRTTPHRLSTRPCAVPFNAPAVLRQLGQSSSTRRSTARPERRVDHRHARIDGHLRNQVSAYGTRHHVHAEAGLRCTGARVGEMRRSLCRSADLQVRRTSPGYQDPPLCTATLRGKNESAQLRPAGPRDLRVVVVPSTGRTRPREPQEAWPQDEEGAHRFHTDWKEPKLLILYVVGDDGRPSQTWAPIIDGTLRGPEAASPCCCRTRADRPQRR